MNRMGGNFHQSNLVKPGQIINEILAVWRNLAQTSPVKTLSQRFIGSSRKNEFLSH